MGSGPIRTASRRKQLSRFRQPQWFPNWNLKLPRQFIPTVIGVGLLHTDCELKENMPREYSVRNQSN
jgi:hypothetical protein